MSCEHESWVWVRLGLSKTIFAVVLTGAVACGGDTPKAVGEDEGQTTADDGDTTGAVDPGDDHGPAVAPETPVKKDAGGTKPAPAPDAGSAAKPVPDASKPVVQTDAASTTPDATSDAGAPPVAAAPGTHVVGPDPTKESASGTAMGPFKTGNMTMGYKDMPGFASGTIWYPTDEAAKPPYACVSVVPGFTAPEASIREWGPFLASYGIVTFTIMTNSAADQPDVRATALLDALESCKAENDRADSPLAKKIDKDRLGVAGWSMGGGGTLIASSKTPSLKAAVSFAAWGPTGGAMNMVPVLMFEATADPLAANMSDSYYMSTPDSVSKMLFEVNGAGHDVANSPKNSSGIIGLYGLSWFKVFLEGDMRFKQFLTADKPSITTSKFKTNVK